MRPHTHFRSHYNTKSGARAVPRGVCVVLARAERTVPGQPGKISAEGVQEYHHPSRYALFVVLVLQTVLVCESMDFVQ